MISYYTILMIILWVSLLILCTLIFENDRLTAREKRRYYLTCLFILLASLAEWTGIQISGNPVVPRGVLRVVKFCDYVLTPLAGGALVGQMRLKNIWSKLLNCILAFNIIFQFISIFTGWMIKIDEQNNYSHGPLYIIYTGIYLCIILLVIVQFLVYGKNFRKQNRTSLYLTMGLVLFGILIQEAFGSDIRTAYLTMTIGAIMLFIHTSEFSQQKTDDFILEQQIQIKTDALTGLLSRHAYSKALNDYSDHMPDDFVVFSIDINGLKTVNDTLGHEAGDELIRGAAYCIEEVFGKFGSCYRTGGDEFMVFAAMDKQAAKTFIQKINQAAAQWKGELVKNLSLSAGYAVRADHPDANCEHLVIAADKGMYEAKDEYYSRTGIKRRTN